MLLVFASGLRVRAFDASLCMSLSLVLVLVLVNVLVNVHDRAFRTRGAAMHRSNVTLVLIYNILDHLLRGT
jgi:hypothetical protein